MEEFELVFRQLYLSLIFYYIEVVALFWSPFPTLKLNYALAAWVSQEAAGPLNEGAPGVLSDWPYPRASFSTHSAPPPAADTECNEAITSPVS